MTKPTTTTDRISIPVRRPDAALVGRVRGRRVVGLGPRPAVRRVTT